MVRFLPILSPLESISRLYCSSLHLEFCPSVDSNEMRNLGGVEPLDAVIDKVQGHPSGYCKVRMSLLSVLSTILGPKWEVLDQFQAMARDIEK
ncbi:hypothetical protein Tco_1052520 [Tanacetum coccineum]